MADMRSSAAQQDQISKEDAEGLKNSINATAYVECSAKTKNNVDTVFINAVRYVIFTTTTRHALLIQFFV